MRPRALLAGGLAVVATALAAGAPAATAASGSVVGVRPADPGQSWLVLRLAPGRTARREALVLNLSDRPQAVRLGATDAVTTADGVFTLAGDGERPRGVGAWITPDAQRLTLAPHEQRRVAITVREPEGTAPGDYAGGLVVQPDEPAGQVTAGGVAVRVLERVGLRVYVTVPGKRDGTVAIEGLSARPESAGGLGGVLGRAAGIEVRFRVAHRGNVVYQHLHGRVEVSAAGVVVSGTPVELETLLPGGARDVRVTVPLPSWRPRDYDVRVIVGALPEATALTRVSVGSVRMLEAGGLALGLIGLGGFGLWRRRARRAR